MKLSIRAVIWAAAAVVLAACEPSREELAERHAATIERYCTDCHNPIDREGGLVLDGADLAAAGEHAAVLEQVTRKLESRMMPPPGAPRPMDETYDAMVGFLETSLDAAAESRPLMGHTPIHRLNRSEYANAVRDLLGIDIEPAEYLPADDEAYGFDNVADILRVSPSLLDQYLAASSRIAALAVGDTRARPVSRVYRAPPDLSQAEHIEGLPIGTRGGLLADHYFPLDAVYDFSVVLQRNIVGYMTGLEWPHVLEITVDGERVFAAPVGGEDDNAMSDENFSAAADSIDARLRARVFVEAGPRAIGVAFLRRSSAASHEPLELHTRDHDLQNMNGLPIVDYLTISGPFEATRPGDTESRRRIFTCRPDAADAGLACAERILSSLARRAYREPVAEADLSLLLDQYRRGAARDGFEAGIQNALRVILTSPKFLFRSHADPSGVAPGTPYVLDDYALASRLSFFLWSSLPDDELLGLAESRRLGTPEVLRAQVRRMLDDPRSYALVDNFAAQWLYLRNLQSARPDIETFPNFDENLRRAMRRETELFFDSVIREDRSVIELLGADYTYLNQRLAEHYGIPGIYGSHYRRVRIADPNRRGLLGHGSILTVTSYPNRTSPVLRGDWILENLLGTPAPAPPPDVPALDENEPGDAPRSVRERLADHRENPTCASCHDIMDPIGLALENFDAVGRWRTREPGGVVDASGQLAGGRPVDGPASLRAALLERPERFVRVVVEKLMTYALGRGLSYHDMPAVRAIARDAAAADYRFSALIDGIVASDSFRMSIARPDEVGQASAEAQTDRP